MKYDIILTGVGGEGVLTSGVVIARAAALEGHYVRGVQPHGLAQRGGGISTCIRFGSKKDVFSPETMQANADLIIGFEPLEAVRSVYYARKEKTSFVINDHPYVPIYANLLNLPYPKKNEIIKKIKPFAKRIHVLNADDLAKEKFGKPIFGNTILIGTSFGAGLIPLKKSALLKSIKFTAPRGVKENLKSFDLGLRLGKKLK
jgi:indolepyruvate ferredoxin oxidoreductase beta subunit